MKKCPVCTIQDDVVTIAVHLTDRHLWHYADAQDWLREQEEKCER